MKRNEPPASVSSPRTRRHYAFLSLIYLLVSLFVVGLLLWKVETIVSFGLTGIFYYIILVCLGLVVSLCLFGSLRSYATYSGKQMGGVLELGGPIVGFAIVVIMGLYLPQHGEDMFAVTVYVHGESGPHDLVLRNSGVVWMTLGADRRQEKIGDKGQADFKGIPSRFRGQDVPVWVEAEGFETASPTTKYSLKEDQLYLPVRKKSARIAGRVQDESGRAITGAVISVSGITVTNSASGRFDISIPGAQVQNDLSLEVDVSGFAPFRQLVTPGANELVVIVRPAP